MWIRTLIVFQAAVLVFSALPTLAQAQIYRIPDSDAPNTCPIQSSESEQNYDPQSIHVDPESKYRLEKISFANNSAVADLNQLRLQFPIKDADIYNSDLIAKGLSNLRHAYASIGYVDFTVVPHLSINEVNNTVALEISFNEGHQFLVNRIDIVGLSETDFQKIKPQVMPKPGEIYNQRLVEFFFEKSCKKLLKHLAIKPRFSLQRNEQNATVAITYDFRQCVEK